MSVGSKSLPVRRIKDDEGAGENGDGGGAVVREEDGDLLRTGAAGGSMRKSRRTAARYDRWFSGLELRIGPGPLKDMDAGKLKGQIRRWAKAVVAFARQISFGGSPRSAASSTPTTSSGAGDTPPSPTLTASRSSSRLSGSGGAMNQQQPPA